jgi:hypothetical protein
VNRAGRELKGVAGGCRNPRQDVADTAVGERSRQLITAHSGFEAVDDLGAVICAQDMPGLALAPGFSLEAGGRLIVRVDLDAQPLADGQDLEQERKSGERVAARNPPWPAVHQLVEPNSRQLAFSNRRWVVAVARQPHLAGACGRAQRRRDLGRKGLGGPYLWQEDRFEPEGTCWLIHRAFTES